MTIEHEPTLNEKLSDLATDRAFLSEMLHWHRDDFTQMGQDIIQGKIDEIDLEQKKLIFTKDLLK